MSLKWGNYKNHLNGADEWETPHHETTGENSHKLDITARNGRDIWYKIKRRDWGTFMQFCWIGSSGIQITQVFTHVPTLWAMCSKVALSGPVPNMLGWGLFSSLSKWEASWCIDVKAEDMVLWPSDSLGHNSNAGLFEWHGWMTTSAVDTHFQTEGTFLRWSNPDGRHLGCKGYGWFGKISNPPQVFTGPLACPSQESVHPEQSCLHLEQTLGHAHLGCRVCGQDC